MKNSVIILSVLLLISAACKTGKNAGTSKREPERTVPIAINIKGSSRDINLINLNVYRFKVLDILEDFQKVDLQLVEPDENPEIVLDLNVDNFIIWPKNERVSRRTVSSNIVVGNDASGKPVYQTVRATLDVVQAEISSNARLLVNLAFKGTNPKVFERSFAPNYRWTNVYVTNIQGDPRAVNPSVYSATFPPIDPTQEDFLLALSQQEMLRRLSDEIRNYYAQLDKPAL